MAINNSQEEFIRGRYFMLNDRLFRYEAYVASNPWIGYLSGWVAGSHWIVDCTVTEVTAKGFHAQTLFLGETIEKFTSWKEIIFQEDEPITKD